MNKLELAAENKISNASPCCLNLSLGLPSASPASRTQVAYGNVTVRNCAISLEGVANAVSQALITKSGRFWREYSFFLPNPFFPAKYRRFVNINNAIHWILVRVLSQMNEDDTEVQKACYTKFYLLMHSTCHMKQGLQSFWTQYSMRYPTVQTCN